MTTEQTTQAREHETGPDDLIEATVSDEVLRIRIRKIAGETREGGMLRRVFAAPLLAVIVAGILGGWLGHRYDVDRLLTENRLIETRATAERLQLERQTEFARAFETFESLSRLLDKRLWRARRLAWSRDEKLSAAEREERRVQYRETVDEWNENLNRNLAFVETYFGQESRGILEGEISDGLRAVHAELTNRAVPSDQLSARIDDLNSKIYTFNIRLLSMAQAGDVGSFRHGK